MKKLVQTLAIICAIVAIVLGGMTHSNAQVAAWGQCGGQGYTGQTFCVSGYSCTYSTPFYSQCLPGDGGGTIGIGCPDRCGAGGCGSSQCSITGPTIPGTGGGGASKSVTATDGYFACCYNTGVTIYALAYPNSCCPLD